MMYILIDTIDTNSFAFEEFDTASSAIAEGEKEWEKKSEEEKEQCESFVVIESKNTKMRFFGNVIKRWK